MQYILPTSAAEYVGCKQGWYYAHLLWKICSIIDLLLGGVGLQRGCWDTVGVFVEDIINFCRVEKIMHNHAVFVKAEMKRPGRAWLVFEVAGDGQEVVMRQTSIFDPLALVVFYGCTFQEMLHESIKVIIKTAKNKGCL